MHIIRLALFLCVFLTQECLAQSWNKIDKVNRSDSLRGSIGEGRSWWNVVHYDISIHPDFGSKSLSGRNEIRFRTISSSHADFLQIDLQSPMHIDSVFLKNFGKLSYIKSGPACYFVKVPPNLNQSATHSLIVYFSGKPHEAIAAPWDGGWIWKKDSLGHPWVTVACQGIGASAWFPNKDHQYDEPDSGALLSIRAPAGLVAISNGRQISTIDHLDGSRDYNWNVETPINNYNIIPYIGRYSNFKGLYHGEKGILDLDFWAINYNEQKAIKHLPGQVHAALKTLEKWFGPFPFYRDGYKIIETPGFGMEHQSAIAYGNFYRMGNKGSDFSQTGWGLKFDFLVIHETAHEWFGNSITTLDLADKWVHESFAAYAEALYLLDNFGHNACEEYVVGMRENMVQNDRPIIGPYGVNKEGSTDMFAKGRNIVHMIRLIVNDDEKFRQTLRKMNSVFYHKIVSSEIIETFLIEETGLHLNGFFDQYLRTTLIPTFEYKVNGDSLKFRFTNCIPEFEMPLKVQLGENIIWLDAKASWQTTQVPTSNFTNSLLTVDKGFYVDVCR